jgi:hypothetical protein
MSAAPGHVSTLSQFAYSFSRWLTLRRLRAQAATLALVLWGVCAADHATPGLFDRARNLKFQDFIVFPLSARLIAQGRPVELYDGCVLAEGIRAIIGHPTTIPRPSTCAISTARKSLAGPRSMSPRWLQHLSRSL